MENLETSDCTDESRKDETCLQFKMKKNFIKTRKISRNLLLYKCYCNLQNIKDSKDWSCPYFLSNTENQVPGC